MAGNFDRVDDTHRAFIDTRPPFFPATAAPLGRVDLSPNGMHSLRTG